MQKENRLFKRYKLPDDAVYVYCKDSKIKGLLTDISSNGMGIRYFPIGNFRPESEFKFILAGNKISMYVPDIACKIIHDREAEKIDLPVTGEVMRHCGVQFGKLNRKIKKELNGMMRFENNRNSRNDGRIL